MNTKPTYADYEKRMLRLPIAGKVSGEDEEHARGHPEFVELFNPDPAIPCWLCMCERCRIIRIKRRRAHRFPRTKCDSCGELFVSTIYLICPKCRLQESHD